MNKYENLTERYLWVESYRPRKLEDIVLPEEYRKTFENYIHDGEIPNLLLIGTQGSGKTTLGRILVNEILNDEDDLLMLNGSSATGVDVVRNQIEEYLRVPAMGGSKIKIVFIDEADYLSTNAQAALRHVIEKYSDTARFLMTANYKSKIIDPIFSRVTEFEFKRLPIEFIKKYCFGILDSEKIKYEKGFVEKVISMFYPDVRRIVNTLQGKVDKGKLISDFESLVSSEKKAISFVVDLCTGLKDNNPKLIGGALDNTYNLLKEEDLDYVSLYGDLFETTLPMWAKIIINRYANEHQSCLIPAFHWTSMLLQIGAIGRDTYRLSK